MKLELERVPGLSKLYDVVYRAIELESTKYENLYSMARMFDKYNAEIWIDEYHVTPIGNRLIAQRMLDVMMARNRRREIKPGR